MSLLNSLHRILLSLLLACFAGPGRASDIPGLDAGRRFVVLLIEDHGGMKEVAWDPAFPNGKTPGVFKADHRYGLITSGAAGLVDLGCWDEVWPNGNGWRAGAIVVPTTRTADGKGMTLTTGGKSTWIPILGDYAGKGQPSATYRGAYLNWLLQNRGTTPSIPAETRWQRVQRGAMGVAEELLTRSGGAPVYRIVGLGTSGSLLIPPGEGLPAAQNAIQRMEPSSGGSMEASLQRALNAVEDLKVAGGCTPGIVLLVSEGMTKWGVCGAAVPYAAATNHASLQSLSARIAATAQAAVWTWAVDGSTDWSMDLARRGFGLAFQADAAGPLRDALKAWKKAAGAGSPSMPPVLSLRTEPTGLTRLPQATLVVTVDRPLASATLDGAAVVLTGLETRLPVTLREGPNHFTVAVRDGCGASAQAEASLTLDTLPPVVTFVTPLDGLLTNAPTVDVSGRVDDLTATLALNGVPVPLDPSGTFRTILTPAEGPLTLRAEATDPAGNVGSATRTLRVDRTAPRITLTRPVPALTNQTSLAVQGLVDDLGARLTMNGVGVILDGQGGFSVTVPLPAEGSQGIHLAAADAAGNVGTLEAQTVRDTTPPVITLDPPLPAVSRAANLAVAGTLSEPVAAMTLNGAAVDATGTTFRTATVLTVVGANPLALSATDLAGNVGSLSASVTYDDVDVRPLQLVVTAPVDGALTNVPSIALSGTVNVPTAIVTVNGQPLMVDAVGGFLGRTDLVLGSNTLDIQATASGGRSASQTRKVRFVEDLALVLRTPVEGLRTNASVLRVTGQVSDPAATVTVQGSPVPLDTTGSFALDLPVPEGPTTIRVEAVDVYGRKVGDQRSVLVDRTSPVVTITAPKDGFVSQGDGVTVTGTVDDPSSRLLVGGQSVTPDASGAWTLRLSLPEGSHLLVALATDPFGNSGHATSGLTLDNTPPVLTWILPTPEEGARWSTSECKVAATLSERATVQMSGNPSVRVRETEPGEAGPFLVTSTLAVKEGPLSFTLEAKDAAGNVSRITRAIQVGLTAPVVEITSPTEGATVTTTRQRVEGRVLGPAFTAPFRLWINDVSTTLDAEGRFATDIALQEGRNPIRGEAENRFGQKGRVERVIYRYAEDLRLSLEWPLEGMVTAVKDTEVRGRVSRPAASVQVAGLPAVLGADKLTFTARVPLVVGANALKAVALDAVGKQAEALVQVTRVEDKPPTETFTWTDPVARFRSATRTVAIKGSADRPGVTWVRVDGQYMTLSPGQGRVAFEGEIRLAQKGSNTLVLEVGTVSGKVHLERREVSFVPEFPRLRLSAPDGARQGEEISLSVAPEFGTDLVRAECSWNGQTLAVQTPPFTPMKTLVPGNAAVGSRLLFEVRGTDAEGETVTGRAYVTVLGMPGATLLTVLDDRTGLPLAGAQLQGMVGTEPSASDGRLLLPALAPSQWVQIQREAHAPVWRRGDQLGSKALALHDARLTPMEAWVDPSASGFEGRFAGGAYQVQPASLTLPSGARLSVTPLSLQGLPALLPAGWSPVAALWFALKDGSLSAPARLALTLPKDAPTQGLSWCRFDAAIGQWLLVATPADASGLPLPAPGGYTLLVADPGTPPVLEAGKALPILSTGAWRGDLKPAGQVSPDLLPTVEAIRGARALARLDLGFEGGLAVASGTPLLAELLETYTLVDQAVILPEKRPQDAVAARWVLGVDDKGIPSLRSAGDGLSFELPVRMSRTFREDELVSGLIRVDFFHEDQQITTAGGSLLVDAQGGTLDRDDILLRIPAGAVSAQVLVRLAAEPSLEGWKDLPAGGTVHKAFVLDVAGTLQAGLELAFRLPSLPADARPLVIQRRPVLGSLESLVLGSLRKDDDLWRLDVPMGAPALLQGGSFAVWSPAGAWDWVLGQARLTEPSGTEVPAPDTVVRGGLLASASGSGGGFAVAATPVTTPGAVELRGSRADLGLKGTALAACPGKDVLLRLAPEPFRIAAVLPAEAAVVGLGAAPEVLLTSAADAVSLGGVRLYLDQAPAGTPAPEKDPDESGRVLPRRTTEKAAPEEVALRRVLSGDGLTLTLVPEANLRPGGAYRLEVAGLKSRGTALEAPALTRRFSVALPADPGILDLSRASLSYPDEALLVQLVLPEGSVPPLSLVEVLGMGFGSTATALMPAKGPLTLTLRAALGERIRIVVQTRDGRTVMTHLSRYVAADGRTTLGEDGGRVEGPGGMAATLPAGALSAPVEVQIQPLTTVPEADPGVLAPDDRLVPALKLTFSRPVTLQKPPRIEVPRTLLGADQDLHTRAEDLGNGPVPVFVREDRTLPDGSLDHVHRLMDTVQLSTDGQRLEGLGGLRFDEGPAGTAILTPPVAAGRVPYRASQTQPGLVERGTVEAFGGDLSSLLCYLACLPSDPGLDRGYLYHQGTVLRNWNGLKGPVSLPAGSQGLANAGAYNILPGAEVVRYRGMLGLDAVRRGRLSRGRVLATADAQGRYVNIGGPLASALPGQSWIALYAMDPRTGETSIDPGAVTPEALGHTRTRKAHHLTITSVANPFDPSLVAPRLALKVIDAQGVRRSVVEVGEKAELEVGLEPFSQSVARGRLRGDLEREFGSILAHERFEVIFDKEGPWHVEAEGWSSATGPDGQPRNIRCFASLDVVVMPKGKLGPAVAGAPRILSVSPADKEPDQEPSQTVKLVFSEPVKGVVRSAFSLKAGETLLGARVLAGGQEIWDGASDAFRQVQEVWLVPEGRLPLGQEITVQVKGGEIVGGTGPLSGGITDTGGEPFAGHTSTFKVRGAEVLGSVAADGDFVDLAACGDRLFAVERYGSATGISGGTFGRYAIRVFDVTDPTKPAKGLSFGPHGAWSDAPMASLYANAWARFPFYSHEVTGLKVVRGVTGNLEGLPGQSPSRDLLLVLSRPWQATELASWDTLGNNEYRSRHNTLWAFDVTAGALPKDGVPRLVGAWSLGTLSDNWGKAAIGTGGMFGVVRLRGGISLWGAEALRAGVWADADTIAFAGAYSFAPFPKWGEAVLAYRAHTSKGYFPPPEALQVSNGLMYETRLGPSVTSATLSTLDDGRPVAFSVAGYGAPRLFQIDTRIGGGEATATYLPGGPGGLDGRMADLTSYLDDQKPILVEAVRGQWQGFGGSQEGLLLLVATETSFHVMQGTGQGTDKPLNFQKLALGPLTGTPVKLQVDPERMLAAVRTKQNGTFSETIFDLQGLNLPWSHDPKNPYNLQPMTTIPVGQAASVLFGGKVAVFDSENRETLVIKNIDSMVVEAYVGVPIEIPVDQTIAGTSESYGMGVEKQTVSSRTTSSSREKSVGDTEYLYAMAKVQLDNNGFPWLRYYYPDLTTSPDAADPNRGKMQLSVILSSVNEKLRDLIAKDPSLFGVQIKAVLSNGSTTEPIDVTHLKVKDNSLVPVGSGASFLSPISMDGDNAKLRILADTNAPGNPGTQDTRKFLYVPFEFRLPDDLRSKYEKEMMADDADRWRIKVDIYVREKDKTAKDGYKTKDAADKSLQFIVKYNANTTLFDIAKGGIWHWDPKLSGSDYSKLDENPNTIALAQGDSELRTRAAVTPTIYGLDTDSGEFRLDPRKALDPDRWTLLRTNINARTGRFSLKDAKLDLIQMYMDKAARGLRQRKPFKADIYYSTDLQPEPSFDRDSYFNWTPLQVEEAKKNGEPATFAGDSLGGYGYKTLAFVNALQRFWPEEAGSTPAKPVPGRDLLDMDQWAVDPAANSQDLVVSARPEDADLTKNWDTRWKIMPALRQGLLTEVRDPKDPSKTQKRFDVNAMYFHYFAAYPATRAFTVFQNKTYPISSLITRELVFGPSKTLKGWASQPAPSGLMGKLGPQRELIEECLGKIRAVEDRKDSRLVGYFAELAGALEAQDIVTILSDKREKEMFNPGIGILQLALSKSWIRFPGEAPTLTRPMTVNENQLFISEPPKTWSYDKDQTFNDNYYEKILQFMTDENGRNWRAGRIDLLINGVATGAEVLKSYMDHMQANLTSRERAYGAPWTKADAQGPARAPFIACLNFSRKLRQGTYGGAKGVLNFFDAAEMFCDWLTPLDPSHLINQEGAATQNDWRLFNPDAIRLIGVLRAVVQVLRSDAFKAKYYSDQINPNIKAKYWNIRITNETNTGEVQPLLPHLYKKVGDGNPLLIQPIDYEPEKDPGGIALKAFRDTIGEEINRLEGLIENYPIVLNAHSQGTAKSAIAMRRVGSVPYLHGQEDSREWPIVSKLIHLISYGGVAGMNEWGKDPDVSLRYKTFTHHLNLKDPARLMGMGKPFGLFGQDYLKSEYPAFRTAWDAYHHVIWHKRKSESENVSSGLLFWKDFTWHRFWTYDCNIPVTKIPPTNIRPEGEMDLEDLTKLPKESTESQKTPWIRANKAKEMCEPPLK